MRSAGSTLVAWPADMIAAWRGVPPRRQRDQSSWTAAVTRDSPTEKRSGAAAERDRPDAGGGESRSAPADLRGVGRGDAGDAGGRRVGDEGGARIVEVEAVAHGGLRALRGEVVDRLDAERGHLQRVLLGGSADDAGLDEIDPGAATIDGDDEDARCLAGGREGLVRPVRGRLVDRVDDVDVGVLGETVLHRGLATVFSTLGRKVAGDLVRAAAVAA